MAAVELFTNLASTTVSSGGTTAPAPGTTETWTVASSATFPAAVTGTSQFHVQEDDPIKQSEIILVTNVSGTTWSVTRGVEGTAPVAHTAGFTIVQTVTKAVLDGFAQLGAANIFTQDQTVNKTIPALALTDGTRTGRVSIASAANDVFSGSAAGDMVLTSQTGKIYVPGNIGVIGQIGTFGSIFGSNLAATGLTGYTSTQNASRYVGATTNGPPSNIGGAEAYVIGDWVPDRSGRMWVCTVAGTPGTWVEVGGTRWLGTRTLPGSNNTVDLGTFASTNGAFQVNLMMTVDVAGFIVTKSYELDVTASLMTASTWYKVLPQDATQNSGATTDFTLEVNRNATTNAYTFRIRQVGATGGTLYWDAEGYGVTGALTFTPSTSTTAAPAAVSTVWLPTPLFEGPGRVGINTDAPSVELDVVGAAKVSGALTRGGFGVATGSTSASPMIQSGTTTITITAATNNTKAITFTAGPAFTTVPIVLVGTASTSAGGLDFIAGVLSTVAITTSGFTAWVEFAARASGTGTATIYWVAIGT